MRVVVRASAKQILRPTNRINRQRRLIDAVGRISILPRGVRVTRVELGGRPAELIEPASADTTAAVLYLHGGGYTVGSFATHRALVAHLAAASGAPVYLLDYRLAPEHPFPAALDDAVAAYDALRSTGVRVAVAGDSAGGGLAVALALQARDTGRSQPASLALVSPWVDLSLVNVADDRRDPFLRRAWLKSCAGKYAGDEVRRPEVSPIHADLVGLAPMLVQGASKEILLGDIERFVSLARAAGVAMTYQRLDRMWHVAQLQAGLMNAATDAAALIGSFLRESLEATQAPARQHVVSAE